MSSIKCPECGKELNDSSRNCPRCGFVLKKGTNYVKEKDGFFRKYKTTIIIVMALFIGMSFKNLIFKENDSNSNKDLAKLEYSIIHTEQYDFNFKKRTKFLLAIDNSKFNTTEDVREAYLLISKQLKKETNSDEVFVIFFNDSYQALSNCWQLGRICISDINQSKNEIVIRELRNYSLEELAEKDGFRIKDSDNNGNILPPTKKEGELYEFINTLLFTTNLDETIIFQQASEKFRISSESAKRIYSKLSMASII